jgi:hypothetical protein
VGAWTSASSQVLSAGTEDAHGPDARPCVDAWTSASSQVLSPTVSIHSATVSVHTAATKETRAVSDSPNVSQCLFSVSVHNPFASAKKKGKQIPLTCNRRSVDSGPEFWAALPPVRESGLSSPDICVC